MVMLFDRKVEVEVGKKGEEGFIYDQTFKMEFSVERSNDSKKPDGCNVKIYNINEENFVDLIDESDVYVRISAGYEDIFGLIYEGDVSKMSINSAATEKILEITSGDGLNAIKNIKMKKSFAKLTKVADAAKDMMNTIKNFGKVSITQSAKNIVGNLTKTINAGLSVRGNVYNSFNNLLKLEGYNPVIINNELHIVDSTGATITETVNLSVDTGLLESPRQKYEKKKVNKRVIKTPGVTFKALIQPKLQIGRNVNIEAKYVEGEYTIQRLNIRGSTLDGGDFTVEAFAI